MVIGKLLLVCVKGVGKLLSSKAGKIAIATGTAIGVGLSGNGVRLAVGAKKKNIVAHAIQQESLSRHESKLNQTNNIIVNLGIEEKMSIELINLFMKLTEKINKCPSMNEIDSKIKLPSITPIDLKKMSNGLDIALAGVGGGVAGALPGLVFCGASLSTLGLAALGGGVVLSIKGSKLSKQAVNNVKQAKKLAADVDSIVKFYEQVDKAAIKLTEAIKKIIDIYKKKLFVLEILVERNHDYNTYSKNEKTLVKTLFILSKLIANMCETKLIKREKEVEIVYIKEIEEIVKNADKICKEARQGIFEKVFP